MCIEGKGSGILGTGDWRKQYKDGRREGEGGAGLTKA